MKDKNKVTNSLGFFDLLAILFIALKLIGFINWSWLWVLSPIWIPASLVVVIYLLALIISIIKK